jgi:hypothetical protein
MPLVLLDVETLVDNLRGIRADLESQLARRGRGRDDARSYSIGLVLDQLGQRIVALEATARHHGTTDLEVTRLTAEERNAVERSIAFLDRELVLEDGPASPTTWARLRGVLAATDDILLAAARGHADEDAASDTDSTRGPALVLALSRAKR